MSLNEHDSLLLQNKYSLVKGAARRARQLQSGAPSLGVSNSLKACRVATDEVRAGKVTYTVGAYKPLPGSAA
ncbi:DNA-directed RNA polymerase subunit omega [Granulicella paludicola]|uniref:DNA-directed RNA polymerase subunit omega n=1 Tax=Granulicella paludicola TaxID=474951 RepID=UPI0021DF5094|nr:DNA-directed RNA polymerase subunit omega [Granulicella paludicola]